MINFCLFKSTMRAPESSHSSRSTMLKQELIKNWVIIIKRASQNQMCSRSGFHCAGSFSSGSLIPPPLRELFLRYYTQFSAMQQICTFKVLCLPQTALIGTSKSKVLFLQVHSSSSPSSTALHHPPVSLCPHWCCLRQQDPVWTPVLSGLPRGKVQRARYTLEQVAEEREGSFSPGR